jgi:hypothetical protein
MQVVNWALKRRYRIKPQKKAHRRLDRVGSMGCGNQVERMRQLPTSHRAVASRQQQPPPRPFALKSKNIAYNFGTDGVRRGIAN